jgi:23S rRNA pseudouridine1911/1915/1917 synthase
MDKLSINVIDSNRLDTLLAQELNISRNQISNLIKDSNVKVNGVIIQKSGLKLKPLDKVEVNFPEPKVTESIEVDFDVEVIFENSDILVLNKPPFLTVHPAPSVKEATLVDWLKSKNYRLSTISGEERHGIVHRLDKETSGVMVTAKTNESHTNLSNQLQDKSMGRYYLAIIDLPLKDDIEIEKPIARNPSNRLKMGVVNGGKEAKSRFVKLQQSPKGYELIACKLFTGRTHQIRVHLGSISRHILGDKLYGFKPEKPERMFLHSYILYMYDLNGKKIEFIAKLNNDMREFLDDNFDRDELKKVLKPEYIKKRFEEFNLSI